MDYEKYLKPAIDAARKREEQQQKELQELIDQTIRPYITYYGERKDILKDIKSVDDVYRIQEELYYKYFDPLEQQNNYFEEGVIVSEVDSRITYATKNHYCDCCNQKRIFGFEEQPNNHPKIKDDYYIHKLVLLYIFTKQKYVISFKICDFCIKEYPGIIESLPTTIEDLEEMIRCVHDGDITNERYGWYAKNHKDIAIIEIPTKEKHK